MGYEGYTWEVWEVLIVSYEKKIVTELRLVKWEQERQCHDIQLQMCYNSTSTDNFPLFLVLSQM